MPLSRGCRRTSSACRRSSTCLGHMGGVLMACRVRRRRRHRRPIIGEEEGRLGGSGLHRGQVILGTADMTDLEVFLLMRAVCFGCGFIRGSRLLLSPPGSVSFPFDCSFVGFGASFSLDGRFCECVCVIRPVLCFFVGSCCCYNLLLELSFSLCGRVRLFCRWSLLKR
ncbi:hypothetical protein FN846DRAFT_360749 [Sphaerosporella brunnea]|uniref:Uncharacterized protein n=1 Tax=Sphaerosporella brunnea TaxID=1250544 RepID=A0A5J5F653_9PEZI|nr:hypothetical protein FN846DRAFT_360749 [Sphaerosporella brunnea]